MKIKSEPIEDLNEDENDSFQSTNVKEEYLSQDEDSMNLEINTDSVMSAASAKSEDSEEDVPLVNVYFFSS